MMTIVSFTYCIAMAWLLVGPKNHQISNLFKFSEKIKLIDSNGRPVKFMGREVLANKTSTGFIKVYHRELNKYIVYKKERGNVEIFMVYSKIDLLNQFHNRKTIRADIERKIKDDNPAVVNSFKAMSLVTAAYIVLIILIEFIPPMFALVTKEMH